MKKTIAVLTVLAGLSVTACAQLTLTQRVTQKIKETQTQNFSPAFGQLDPAPAPADYTFLLRDEYPDGQPSKVTAPQQMDIRSGDVSAWDLTEYTAEELGDVLTFDSKTRFPSADKLPRGFNARRLLENGKNPGLGVRQLHAQGITGKDVSVAIIDQSLLTSHQEYASRVVWYEESPVFSGHSASMHGAAVASILLGKTVGVAPQAQLFHFAAEFKETNNRFDAGPIVQTLQKIQQLNKRLLPENKIRVVSISRGFGAEDRGAEDFSRVCRELETSGVLVLTTNDVFTLSRTHANANPDETSAHQRPAYWFLPHEYALYNSFNTPLVPTDFRTTASPTGNGDYVLYANGGLSWAVPYLAGLYALAVQVNPSVTPAQFRETVLKTSQNQNCEFAGKKFQAKTLINPAALIEAVRGLNQ